MKFYLVGFFAFFSSLLASDYVTVFSFPMSGEVIKMAIEETTPSKVVRTFTAESYQKEMLAHAENPNCIVMGQLLNKNYDFIYDNYPNIYMIFMIRDLRDTVLAAVDYIDKFGLELWPQLIEKVSSKEWETYSRKKKILTIINHKEFSLAPMVDVLKNFEWGYQSWTIKYEDLIGTKGFGSYDYSLRAINQIAYIFGIELDEKQAERIVKKIASASDSLSLTEGKMGRWRSEFDEEIKKAFKKELGSALIRLGYEKDNNW